MKAEIESVTITIVGRRGAVTIVQGQPADPVVRASARRSGRDLLNAAVADARSWMIRNGRPA